MSLKQNTGCFKEMRLIINSGEHVVICTVSQFSRKLLFTAAHRIFHPEPHDLRIIRFSYKVSCPQCQTCLFRLDITLHRRHNDRYPTIRIHLAVFS